MFTLSEVETAHTAATDRFYKYAARSMDYPIAPARGLRPSQICAGFLSAVTRKDYPLMKSPYTLLTIGQGAAFASAFSKKRIEFKKFQEAWQEQVTEPALHHLHIRLFLESALVEKALKRIRRVYPELGEIDRLFLATLLDLPLKEERYIAINAVAMGSNVIFGDLERLVNEEREILVRYYPPAVS